MDHLMVEVTPTTEQSVDNSTTYLSIKLFILNGHNLINNFYKRWVKWNNFDASNDQYSRWKIFFRRFITFCIYLSVNLASQNDSNKFEHTFWISEIN